jgi:hypothetical protein
VRKKGPATPRPSMEEGWIEGLVIEMGLERGVNLERIMSWF